MADAFRQQQLYLHTEKSIEDINKYRSIEKRDRSVSVSNDGSGCTIIVSRKQRTDRLRKEVLVFVGASFSAS